MSKTAIVILNWNGKSWLEKFLPSVVAHSNLENCEVIVADNGSTENILEFIAEFFPTINLIQLDKNYGFTGGYNRALAQIEADYYVLLNTDVEVTENWLQPMIERLNKNPKIAACQPKILAYNNKKSFEYAGASGGFIDKFGYPFCRGRVFDDLEIDKNQYDNAQQIFWATGACLVVRAEVYKQIGGLDEEFFAHMEEIDLCWRMQNADYEIWVEPKSVVYHVGGGTLPQGNPRKTYYNFRNNLMMLFKNLPLAEMIWVVFVRMILDGIAAYQMLFKLNFQGFFAILKAHLAFYVQLPSLIKKRNAIPVKKKRLKLNGMIRNSIVWQYFFKKNKTFATIVE